MITTFGDLGVIFDGPHATPSRRSDGPYFLNIASLKSGRLDLSESDHVSEEQFRVWTRRVEPTSGDLLFSYETRLGEAALMPGGVRACLGRRMALLRPDLGRVDPRFLLYYYLSPEFQSAIERNTIHGATVNRIGLTTMGLWPVCLPKLADQRAVAEVLGALDEKIAANATLIATADEFAASLFEHVAGGTRERIRLGSLADITRGASYRGVDLRPSGIALVTLKSVDRAGLYAERGLKSYTGPYKPHQVIQPGEIVVAQTDLTQAAEVVGRAVRVSPSGDFHTLVASLDLAIVRAKDGIPNEYLLGVMRQGRFRRYCQSHTSGTTVLHLATDAMNYYEAPAISELEREAYAERVGLLHQLMDSTSRESRILESLRDTLIPQLVSGRLRVRDAEKQVEAVV